MKQKNQVLEKDKQQLEIYRYTGDVSHHRLYSDNIEYVVGDLTDDIDRAYIARLYKNYEILEDTVMDYVEYNSTVTSNCESDRPEDYPAEGVRVIVFCEK